MAETRVPQSLRFGTFAAASGREAATTGLLTTAALLAGSMGSAEAQGTPDALPPVTVDPPKVQPRPTVRPTQQQTRARAAIRRPVARPPAQAARPTPSRAPIRPAAATAAPVPGPAPASSTPPGRTFPSRCARRRRSRCRRTWRSSTPRASSRSSSDHSSRLQPMDPLLKRLELLGAGAHWAGPSHIRAEVLPSS